MLRLASLYGAIPYVKCVHLGQNTDLCSLALWPNLFVRETDFPDTLLCLGRIYKKIQGNRSNKIMVSFHTCKNNYKKSHFNWNCMLWIYDETAWYSDAIRILEKIAPLFRSNTGCICRLSRWWKTFSWVFLIIQIIALKDLFWGTF